MTLIMQRNPQAFYDKMFTPEEKAEIKKLAAEIEKKKIESALGK
jgi:hypothetical protein